ncbi:MAG: phosphotransferase family protein [Solirubrobacterales bacterium]|nr:phosphotransferase family protein [Solirubrobacterales bacterium]
MKTPDAGATQEAQPSIATTLAPWLTEVTGDHGPFTVERLSGGNSNETLLVSSPTASRVMRRPPAAAIDASAHNLEREYQMLMALSDTHVPVPRPIATAAQPTPGGPPALLMEHLDGVSLTAELPPQYPAGALETVAYASIDALADLHSLPWRTLGLEEFGRPDGFLERQVRRWQKQYISHQHRELPDFDIVATWLDDNCPPSGEAGILHGDFHCDNCLFSRTEPVRLLAIIDWEMSTIGDPLLDIGLMLGLWGVERPSPCAMPKIQGFSRAPGAPTRAALAQRYENRSGRSLEHLNYYMALALWKLAAIVEGAHLHFTTGDLKSEYAEALGTDVPLLLAEARRFTEAS